MNQRIKELAEQADIIQWDTLPSGARTPDRESVVKAKKFAELIVRECIVTLYRRGVEGFGIVEERMLKEHFGVE